MIDVNKITSTLAKLPDAQLQQYAQMHKSDPYIMALAMSESNRRKEMRAAGQDAQGMQEPPKVVDQMVAEMAPQQLPEDQGIGQLNAGNMNFAGGGIIAFADGGDVERYQVGGMPPRSNTIYDPVTGVPISAEDTSGNDLTFLESLGVFNPENRRALEKADRAAAQKQSALPYNKATMPATGYTRTDPRAAGANTFADSVKAVEAAPTADTTRKGPGAAAPGIAPRATADTAASGIEALQQKYVGGLNQDIGDLRNQRVGLAAGIKELAKQNLAETEAEIAARGDVFKGREERLAKQEKSLEGMGDKYMGLALLQAGAAMMTTPGGIGAALGKGVAVGSERYAAGMEKINAAKDKFAEARDRLDDLRINRDDMNAREIRAAKREANAAELKGQELFYTGAVTDLGMKRDAYKTVFSTAADALRTDKDIASRERVAGAQISSAERLAQRPSGEARNVMLLGTGTTPAAQYESGLKKMQEITADKSGMAAVKLLAEANAKLLPGEPRLTMSDLLTSAREYSTLMYGPKVADVAPTRARP